MQTFDQIQNLLIFRFALALFASFRAYGVIQFNLFGILSTMSGSDKQIEKNLENKPHINMVILIALETQKRKCIQCGPRRGFCVLFSIFDSLSLSSFLSIFLSHCPSLSFYLFLAVFLLRNPFIFIRMWNSHDTQKPTQMNSPALLPCGVRGPRGHCGTPLSAAHRISLRKCWLHKNAHTIAAKVNIDR